MLILILLLIVGSLLAYLSQSNLMLVSLHVGPYIFTDIPLFYVIVGSLVTGLVFSYILYVVHDISTSLTIHGKENVIKKKKNEVVELTKRVHQLELENERLKRKSGVVPIDSNAL
ncbi:MAG: bZIP transcription factor [Candidatus Woesebacteria bacterium]